MSGIADRRQLSSILAYVLQFHERLECNWSTRTHFGQLVPESTRTLVFLHLLVCNFYQLISIVTQRLNING